MILPRRKSDGRLDWRVNDYEIKIGDLLLLRETGPVGFLLLAWPDLNTARGHDGLVMRAGDYIIFLGYSRKRNWKGETGLRFCKLLTSLGEEGWYVERAMDIFEIVV